VCGCVDDECLGYHSSTFLGGGTKCVERLRGKVSANRLNYNRVIRPEPPLSVVSTLMNDMDRCCYAFSRLPSGTLWRTHCSYYTFYGSPQQCYGGPTVRTIPFMAPLSNVMADPLFVLYLLWLPSAMLWRTHRSYPQIRYT
jgi:hypothetical protein